jgi:hypothetical protein
MVDEAETQIAVIDHVPDVLRRELPEVPKALRIFGAVEGAVRQVLGVTPLVLGEGKDPTFEFERCLLAGALQTCNGCKKRRYDDLCERRNCGRPFPRFGFSIGLDKFDDAFTEKLSDSTFRYRHDEALQVLKDMINDTPELAPEIWWDRGMGAFVYNLFFEEPGDVQGEDPVYP